MVKIWTILLILTISTLFLHVPHVGRIGFPTHPTMKDPCTGETVEIFLSYNQYAWMICEHLIMVVLAWMLYDEARDQKPLLKLFVFIQVASLAGFVLSYDDPLKTYVITFNILKLLIFLAAIVISLWHQKNRT